MRTRRDEPPGALVELGYRLRYLGPGEVLRQIATRYGLKSRPRAAPIAKPRDEKPLFDGIKHYEVGPDEICSVEPSAADDQRLGDIVAGQAARIRELEAQLARSREMLSEAHSLVLALRARSHRRHRTSA